MDVKTLLEFKNLKEAAKENPIEEKDKGNRYEGKEQLGWIFEDFSAIFYLSCGPMQQLINIGAQNLSRSQSTTTGRHFEGASISSALKKESFWIENFFLDSTFHCFAVSGKVFKLSTKESGWAAKRYKVLLGRLESILEAFRSNKAWRQRLVICFIYSNFQREKDRMQCSHEWWPQSRLRNISEKFMSSLRSVFCPRVMTYNTLDFKGDYFFSTRLWWLYVCRSTSNSETLKSPASSIILPQI